MNKEKLKMIFEDTKQISKRINSPNMKTIKYVYKSHSFSGDKAGEIIVSPTDTISTVLNNNESGKKICMLNMASYRRPGGGVENGAMAQEECLFRCTNLHSTMTRNFYPLSYSEALYTKNASIIKDAKYNVLDKSINVDCVTVAAIKLTKPILSENEYKQITRKKIEQIIDLPIINDVDILVLCSWGCGVYKNDPNYIAELFKDVLKEKRYNFDKIIFGVINDRNSVDDNYQIFYNILSE